MTLGFPGCGALVVAALLAGEPASAQTRDRPLRLEVDASEIGRGIVHSKVIFSPPPGPLTMYFVKWISGNHRPSGEIENLTGIFFTAAGRPLEWRRDTIDNYTLHCEVPRGATALEVRLDFVNADATRSVATLNWNQVVLYPGGPVENLFVAPRLTLPRGWQCASALGSTRGEAVAAFPTVSLYTLIDSPVLMGEHVRRFDLSEASGPHEELDVAADSDEALDVPPKTIAGMKRLMHEARALLGAPPYRHYQFLTGLGDHLPSEGLEHHECTDIRSKERLLVEKNLMLADGDVFAHELAHAWNGKYRRPAGLVFTDYQQPLNAELLWVYEGLTQYLGYVLTGRSGLFSLEDARMQFAADAAALEMRPGRRWRNLRDTAIGTGPLRGAPRAWSSWRRGQDYYGEGALVWLEADATIRRLSGGSRSLDDFCRRFFGGARGPEVSAYTEADVVVALNEVQPHDWKRFLDERLDQVRTPTPTRAIEATGWRLAFADSVSAYESAVQASAEFKDLRASLGVRLDKNGVMTDVAPDMPAAKAGLAPGAHIVAVGGRKYDYDVLKRALTAGRKSRRPLELLVEEGDFYRTVSIDYHDGPRHAALARIAGQPDYLSEILKPRAGSGTE
jgi:predicted metalloprotease with PDZ domain